MSHSEYMDWLLKIGCGWIGWSAEVTKETHLADIMIAYDGVIDRLKACYGSGEDKKKEKSSTSDIDEDSFDRFTKQG